MNDGNAESEGFVGEAGENVKSSITIESRGGERERGPRERGRTGAGRGGQIERPLRHGVPLLPSTRHFYLSPAPRDRQRTKLAPIRLSLMSFWDLIWSVYGGGFN